MRPKILILDDDTDQLALLEIAFRDAPLDVHFVPSGLKALVAIFEAFDQGEPFTALVMDCALPRFDGFTIARIVRLAETTGIAPRVKIGYFTAFAKTVERSSLLEEVGAEAYWRKPEDIVNLPTLISLWLETEKPNGAAL